MNLFDPHRKRTNDTPELLGRRVAVPRLSLFPREGATTRVSAMVPDDRGRASSRQVVCEVADDMLPKLIARYRNDPEGTLELLFNITLAPIPEPTDRELVRDLRQGRRPALAPAIVNSTYEDIEV